MSVCSSLEGSALRALTAAGQRVIYPKRGKLFMEGEPAGAVFNVVRGLVRAFRLLPDGRRQLVGFALPGDLVGPAFRDTYSFSADAACSTVVCRFPRRGFWDLFGKRPTAMRTVCEAALHQLDVAHDQMVMLGGGSAKERVASFLIGFRERWHRHAKAVLVPLPMGRQDIADFIGLSISTVSRTLNDFARRRLIVIVPGGVRILDSAGLAQLASAPDATSH